MGRSLDRNLLVNGINVGRGSTTSIALLDFEDKNLLVLVLVIGTTDGTVQDNREDEEHAEEDTNTAAKNKRHSSALPRSERHDGVLDANEEVLFLMHVMVVVEVGTRMATLPIRLIHRLEFHGVFHDVRGSWRGHERQDLEPFALGVLVVHLDEGEAKHLAERVGDVDCLLSEHASHAWSLALDLRPVEIRWSYVRPPAKRLPWHLWDSMAKAHGSREVDRAFNAGLGDDDYAERSGAHQCSTSCDSGRKYGELHV